jgi:hypothetical protein
MSKVFEYAYVAWSYVKWRFAYVVGFVGRHPKATLAIVAISHVLRGW